MNTGRRKIHLDFHTHEEIPNVCAHFDADRFADTLVGAGVDCVVLFAKDMFGNAFYHSKVNQVHPGLAREFLPAAAQACRERGISTEAYIAVVLDWAVARQHEDWACRHKNGDLYQWGPRAMLLDLASPLLNEIAIPVTREVAREMPVDGIWFDIVMYPNDGFYGPFFSRRFETLRGERGWDDTPDNRALLAAEIVLQAQERLRVAALEENPALRVIFNNQVSHLGDERAWPLSDVLEVESDPNFWPQFDLPVRCRWLRGTGPEPRHAFHGLTTRFHRCWTDIGGLRHPVQLEYEIGQIMAAGCPWISVGDHLHPSGVLEPAVYRLIGNAYDYCAQIAPLLEGARPLVEVALLVGRDDRNWLGTKSAALDGPLLGAARVLSENHRQWTVCTVASLREPDALEPNTLLILPGGLPLNADDLQTVREAVKRGHPLLACAEHVAGLEDLAGCSASQVSEASYLLHENELADPLIGEMPMALYQPVTTFEVGRSTEIIAHSQETLDNETALSISGKAGPVNPESPLRPTIVAPAKRDGLPGANLNVVLCGAPLPLIVNEEGGWTHLQALSSLLNRLQPHPLVETSIGPTVEIALHRRGDDLLIHVVTGSSSRTNARASRLTYFTPPAPFEVRIQGVESPLQIAPSRSYQTFSVSFNGHTNI